MNQIDKESVIKSFDNAATNYDINAGLQQYIACVLFELCKSYVAYPSRILDIGTGTGYGVRLLCNNYPEIKAVGMDISQQMLLRCKESCQHFSGANYVCADADNLPFHKNIFDLIYSSSFVQWCSDTNQLFQQLRNILQDEGWLFFSSFGPKTLFEMKQSWKVVDEYQHILEFKGVDQIKKELKDNGFEVKSCKRAIKVIQHQGVIAALNSLKDIGAQNHLANRPSGLTSSNRLTAMSESYLKCYGVQGFVPTTYEILLFAAQAR